MIANIDPIQPGDAASPNLWNSRFATLATVVNGNIDSDNLKNGGVTREKIAAGAISSDKLGFEKYVDANGWLITDLGLVKLATKSRTFTIPSVGNGGIGFVQVADNSAPVGFNPGATNNTMIAVNITNGNAYRWNIVFEQGSKFVPTTIPVYRNEGGGTFSATGTLETWVIF